MNAKERARFEQEVIDDLMPKAEPKPKAEVRELYPLPLTEEQLMRRQQAIDATWWQHLRWEAEQKAHAVEGYHKGPGDSDWGR